MEVAAIDLSLPWRHPQGLESDSCSWSLCWWINLAGGASCTCLGPCASLLHELEERGEGESTREFLDLTFCWIRWVTLELLSPSRPWGHHLCLRTQACTVCSCGRWATAVPSPPLACCGLSLPGISEGLSAVALVAAWIPRGMLAMSYVAQLSSLVQEELHVDLANW